MKILPLSQYYNCIHISYTKCNNYYKTEGIFWYKDSVLLRYGNIVTEKNVLVLVSESYRQENLSVVLPIPIHFYFYYLGNFICLIIL